MVCWLPKLPDDVVVYMPNTNFYFREAAKMHAGNSEIPDK